jgi:hypothetical protein
MSKDATEERNWKGRAGRFNNLRDGFFENYLQRLPTRLLRARHPTGKVFEGMTFVKHGRKVGNGLLGMDVNIALKFCPTQRRCGGWRGMKCTVYFQPFFLAMACSGDVAKSTRLSSKFPGLYAVKIIG